MSENSARPLAPSRLPVLLGSVGVGILLITSGIAVHSQQEQLVEVALAGTNTALAPTLTPSITPTASNTPTPTDTPTLTPTPTDTPTGTLPPTNTPTATFTPSPSPIPAATVGIASTYSTPGTESVVPIPTPVEAVDVPRDVENVLVLGSDLRPELHEISLTDTIIVVSINRKEGTVNMLSIPRDLYVYIPGWTVSTINTAYAHGSSVGWEGGGIGLLKETLLYNFGISIDHYAMVGLNGFREIVDAMGGVDVPVDCNYTDYRLKPPQLGPSDFDSYNEYVDYTDPESGNWEVYTLTVGVQHLDGYMALWYARIRKGTDDLDRGMRQQQVLRAILNKARSDGMLNVTRVPQLWNDYSDLVQTSMGLGNMLELAPIAADIDPNEINRLTINDLLIPWTPPAGAVVGEGHPGFVLNPEGLDSRMAALMEPPAQTVVASTAKVEIRNGTRHERLDEIAANQFSIRSRIPLFGIPTGNAPEAPGVAQTVIYDYTGRQKSNQLVEMQRLLKVADANVIAQPNPNRTFDYLIVLGEDYYQLLMQCAKQNPDTKTVPPTPTP